jgi:hypothetical protein
VISFKFCLANALGGDEGAVMRGRRRSKKGYAYNNKTLAFLEMFTESRSNERRTDVVYYYGHLIRCVFHSVCGVAKIMECSKMKPPEQQPETTQLPFHSKFNSFF